MSANIRCTSDQVITGNTFLSTNVSPSLYPDNTYLNGKVPLKGSKIFVFPNQYELGRTHIANQSIIGEAMVVCFDQQIGEKQKFESSCSASFGFA